LLSLVYFAVGLKEYVRHKFSFLPLFMALGSVSYASVVFSLPGGTVDAMPADNDIFVDGPVVFDGITWTATGGVGVFGYTSSWAFSSNGDWDGTLGPMAGVDDNTDIMTFAPSSPVAGIGGFINYAQPGEGTATIAAYNAADVLIESYSLTFTTGGGINVGEFLGFSESTADIAYFELTGATVGLTGLSVQENPSSSSLPEPGTVDLMLAGLGLLMLARKIGLIKVRKHPNPPINR
jgi:hypothetical protein